MKHKHQVYMKILQSFKYLLDIKFHTFNKSSIYKKIFVNIKKRDIFYPASEKSIAAACFGLSSTQLEPQDHNRA